MANGRHWAVREQSLEVTRPGEAKNARGIDTCEEEMKVWNMGGNGRFGDIV